MDIHRSRFVPYAPSAINALAFSHSQPDNDKEDPKSLRLAIGRANGDVEIWNPAKGAWMQERVFPGGKERSVEGLVWTQEPDAKDQQGRTIPGRLRLFSIGYSSSVTEWDLEAGLPARHSSGNHSEVWCFAAQPRTNPNDHQKLVAGCADGTLVLLSTADDDVHFERFLYRSTTKKARVLSVAFKDRYTVVAGFADSTIRVVDIRSASVLRSISLGSGPIGGPKEILVWKVKCLANGDFVSGDSTGDIRIYDGKNYSQLQRISGHEADVLDLAVSRDGTMLFSGGMDRRTCFYSCSKKKGARKESWRKVSHQRYHDHDVKAMATYEGHKLNIMVSGGIDTKPIVMPLRHFGKELSRGLPALPQDPHLASARAARLMVSWWNCEVRIWRVKSKAEGAEKPKVVARIALQGQENITSVSISEDGSLLAVSTAREVKLFHLAPSTPGAGSGIRIRKLELPAMPGAKLVRLAAGGKWLGVVTVGNEVQLLRIVKSEDSSERPRVLEQPLHLYRIKRNDTRQDEFNGPWGRYSRSITHAEFSSTASAFAVADLAGYVDSWIVQGHEDPTAPELDYSVQSSPSASVNGDDSDDEDEDAKDQIVVLGQRWIRNPSSHLLPQLDSAPLLLSFEPNPEAAARPEPNGNPAVHPTRHNPHPHSNELPQEEENLLIVSAKHDLYQFEVLAGRMTEWSRKNPPSSYPAHFRTIHEPVKGCMWDITDKGKRVWLYGENWLFMFDLSKDFPILEHQGTASSKKRKRGSMSLHQTPRNKNNSGAGDAIPQSEVPVSKVRKFTTDQTENGLRSNWIDVGGDQQGPETDEDVEHQALATLRRSAVEGEGTHALDASANADDVGEEGEEKKRNHETWWNSFKYRPILGIVPVGEDGQPLEVVLVERPSWDLDLPPRFVGSHE